MSLTKTIDAYDRNGVFVLMCEGDMQAPIILETEGEFSSYDAAKARRAKITWVRRICICRVVPIEGNELLALDMIRLQPPKREDDQF